MRVSLQGAGQMILGGQADGRLRWIPPLQGEGDQPKLVEGGPRLRGRSNLTKRDTLRQAFGLPPPPAGEEDGHAAYPGVAAASLPPAGKIRHRLADCRLPSALSLLACAIGTEVARPRWRDDPRGKGG